jgi:hypothetical protein
LFEGYVVEFGDFLGEKGGGAMHLNHVVCHPFIVLVIYMFELVVPSLELILQDIFKGKWLL